jgi:hypothetical protein
MATPQQKAFCILDTELSPLAAAAQNTFPRQLQTNF